MAILQLENRLDGCEGPKFKSVVGAGFKNDPGDIANEVSKFVSACEQEFLVEAVYLEMNGFDINPDLWYFDYFGYKRAGRETEDLDWLANWDSSSWPQTTLTGLENAQEEFEWYSSHFTADSEKKRASQAAETAVLLVMCKFAKLIEDVAKTGLITKQIELLATAHDFDIVPRFVT